MKTNLKYYISTMQALFTDADASKRILDELHEAYLSQIKPGDVSMVKMTIREVFMFIMDRFTSNIDVLGIVDKRERLSMILRLVNLYRRLVIS